MKVVTKKSNGAAAKSGAKATPAAKKTSSAKPRGKAKDIEEMTVEPDGKQNRLPGQPRVAVKALVEFAARHEQTKKAHKLLTDQLTEEGEEGVSLYQKYRDHFEDDGTGGKIYTNGEYDVIIPAAALKIKTKFHPVDK